jgi:hypothetical protein
MSVKRDDIQLDLQEDHRQREDHDATNQILHHIAENQGLDFVEGSTPPKQKENCTSGGAGNVEAPAPITTERSD